MLGAQRLTRRLGPLVRPWHARLWECMQSLWQAAATMLACHQPWSRLCDEQMSLLELHLICCLDLNTPFPTSVQHHEPLSVRDSTPVSPFYLLLARSAD